MKILGSAIVGVGILWASLGGHSTTHHAKPVWVTVTAGETLWQICSAHNPGEDTQNYIGQVEQVNHLDANGDVQVGQQIELP